MAESYETYPGSNERLSEGTGEGAAKTGSPDPLAGIGEPLILSMGGVRTEFWTISQLGLALNRKAGTIRKLEEEGNIPRAVWRRPALDSRMRRRLYSRKQIEGLIQIADEEGILRDKQRAISKTRFPARARALFAEDK
jgi:hypothetical protein